MQPKRDLIIIGSNWSDCPSSSRGLFLQLANERRVLWVSQESTPRLGLFDMEDEEELAPSPIQHLQVKAMPWGHMSWLQTINQHWIAKQIRNTVEYLHLHQPILLFLDPAASPLADSLAIETVIYYRDELAEALLDPEQESWLIAKASLLVATSPRQAAAFPAYKTCLLRHEPNDSPQARPRDLPTGRPVIGFHGPLDDHLDWDLLENAARRRPDWYWVLIGPRQTPRLDRLLRLHNVFWLGEKSFEQLQGYLQHWQVTLLPYRNEPSICRQPPLQLEWVLRHPNPVIVSADFVGLPSFKPLLSRVHSMQELTELLPITGGEQLTNSSTQGPYRPYEPESPASLAQPNWELGADEFGLLLDNL